MPKFSKSSIKKLETCDPELQTLFNYVIKYFDCKVIYGHLGERAQNAAFDGGFSTVRYPYSNHNTDPSKAVDVIPWPIQWNNTDRMRYFIGFVKGSDVVAPVTFPVFEIPIVLSATVPIKAPSTTATIIAPISCPIDITPLIFLNFIPSNFSKYI